MTDVSPRRLRAPAATTALLAALVLGPLLAGFEPVGGDPDRVHRPVKAELARGLRAGTLPFWSDRFGLGLPLVAESEAGAFYPPNLVLYRALPVNVAYRLSMWLHTIALALATHAYARRLNIAPWGASLAGVAFPFCGFMAIHSSHEWSYQVLVYLPLALLLADRYAETGRLRPLGLLALVLGAQWTLGHFQLQAWTGGLVAFVGGWRVAATRAPKGRIAGLLIAVAGGMLVAMVQLGPTWELAKIAGHTTRGFSDLAYYYFPPAHLPELAIPRLFRGLPGGHEDPYWFTQNTTGVEACFYVGTIPLILAFVGACAGRRDLDPWRAVVVLSVVLATMPAWAPGLFARLIALPVLGHFRCPARYTVLASFGLCLLAGAGLDRGVSRRRFALGLGLALAFGVAAFAFGAWWVELPSWRGRFAAVAPVDRFGPAAVAWLVAVVVLAAWRAGKLHAPVLVVLTAVELAVLYYTMTTAWGWAVHLPDSSPALTRLRAEPGPIRVGGGLDNLPVRAGLATGSPYFGFRMPEPQPLLAASQRRGERFDPVASRWLRRLGMTHLVVDAPDLSHGGAVIWTGRDPALDVLAYRDPGTRLPRTWRVVRLDAPFPAARVVTSWTGVPTPRDLLARLSAQDDAESALFVGPPPAVAGPPATRARLVSWDGRAAVVEHDGACLLVVARTSYPGWTSRIDAGPPLPVLAADGGLHAVPVPGRGTSRVTFAYRPTWFAGFAACSVAATLAALAAIGLDRRP